MSKYGPIYNDLLIKYPNKYDDLDEMSKKIDIIKITNNEIFTNKKDSECISFMLLVLFLFLFLIVILFWK